MGLAPRRGMDCMKDSMLFMRCALAGIGINSIMSREMTMKMTMKIRKMTTRTLMNLINGSNIEYRLRLNPINYTMMIWSSSGNGASAESLQMFSASNYTVKNLKMTVTMPMTWNVKMVYSEGNIYMHSRSSTNGVTR